MPLRYPCQCNCVNDKLSIPLECITQKILYVGNSLEKLQSNVSPQLASWFQDKPCYMQKATWQLCASIFGFCKFTYPHWSCCIHSHYDIYRVYKNIWENCNSSDNMVISKNHYRPTCTTTHYASIQIKIAGGVSCITEQELFCKPKSELTCASQ